MEYNTLTKIFPPYKNKQEAEEQLKSSYQEMLQYGREDYSNVEMAFVATLDKHTEVFEKVKKMLAKNRITVRYIGDTTTTTPRIDDFEIIALDTRESSE